MRCRSRAAAGQLAHTQHDRIKTARQPTAQPIPCAWRPPPTSPATKAGHANTAIAAKVGMTVAPCRGRPLRLRLINEPVAARKRLLLLCEAGELVHLVGAQSGDQPDRFVPGRRRVGHPVSIGEC